MRNSILFLGLILLTVLMSGCTQEEQIPPDVKIYEQDIISVNLCEKFWLIENQTASVESEDLQLKLTKIIYSPCPEGVMCIWSGLGAEFEVSKYNKTMLSIESHYKEFFGFKIDMMEVTQTYVGFKISKI